MQYVVFCIWFISLRVMFLRSLCVMAHRWVVVHCTDVPHFIYLFIGAGRLGCLHVCTVVSNAVMSARVQVCVWTRAFTSLGLIPRSAIPGSYDQFIFNFSRVAKWFTKVAASFYTPTHSEWGIHSFLLSPDTGWWRHLLETATCETQSLPPACGKQALTGTLTTPEWPQPQPPRHLPAQKLHHMPPCPSPLPLQPGQQCASAVHLIPKRIRFY